MMSAIKVLLQVSEAAIGSEREAYLDLPNDYHLRVEYWPGTNTYNVTIYNHKGYVENYANVRGFEPAVSTAKRFYGFYKNIDPYRR